MISLLLWRDDLRVVRKSTPAAIRAWGVFLLFFALPAAHASTNSTGAADADIQTNNTVASQAWHFRLGPFFEIGQGSNGVNMLAVRPLFSRVTDTAERESITDVVWPWSSFHRRDDYFHWWALPAFGKDENVRDPLSRHTFWLLPIYCEGRTRDGKDFAAIFPLGGTICGFLMQDEMNFVLFPLYLDYHSAKQKTTNWLWPLYLREEGPLRDRFQLFPFYCEKIATNERSYAVCWPIWNRTVFDYPKLHGTADILFPIYGSVDTDKQKGWMALPPFFSRMEVEGKTQLRCPWPFYVNSDNADNSHKDSFWPIWDQTASTNGHRRTAIWPLWWDSQSDYYGRRETDVTLVPFYQQTRSEKMVEGKFVTDMDYVRVWPIFSRYERPEGTRIRFPELTFMREGLGIERNWAPLWSLYVSNSKDDASDHDVLWGLARWGTTCDHTTYGQAGPIFSWAQPQQGAFGWNFLCGLIGRETDPTTTSWRWLWFWHTTPVDVEQEPKK
jgi:hypothetical protein